MPQEALAQTGIPSSYGARKLLERQVNESNEGSSPHFKKTYQYKLVKQRKTNHVF
jgi:hypothetical protein